MSDGQRRGRDYPKCVQGKYAGGVENAFGDCDDEIDVELAYDCPEYSQPGVLPRACDRYTKSTVSLAIVFSILCTLSCN